jgi:hypothetical protein
VYVHVLLCLYSYCLCMCFCVICPLVNKEFSVVDISHTRFTLRVFDKDDLSGYVRGRVCTYMPCLCVYRHKRSGPHSPRVCSVPCSSSLPHTLAESSKEWV